MPASLPMRAAAGLVVAAILAGCVSIGPDGSPSAAPGSPGDSLPPGASPVGTALPTAFVPTPEPSPTQHTYIVRPGDTLSGIGDRFRLSVGQLLYANRDIIDPNHIEVGQVIVIPEQDSPSTLPASDGLADIPGDLVDPSGFPADAPSYADFLGLKARIRTDTLELSMRMASEPRSADPDIEQLTWTVNIDTDGDGTPEWSAAYTNTVPGEVDFAPVLTNLATGETQSGLSFPGAGKIDRDVVTLTVDRNAIGRSREYQVAAKMERSFFPGGVGDPEVETSLDFVPDQQWPRPNPRWLGVGI